MKIGIKEFRERIAEVTASGEPVVITHHGRPVASYAPFKRKDLEAVRKAATDIDHWQTEMKAKGINFELILEGLGLDPWGEPVDVSDR